MYYNNNITKSSFSNPSEGVNSSSSSGNEMRLGDEGGSGIKDELLDWSSTEETLLLAIKLDGLFSRFAIVFSASMSSRFVLQLSSFSSFADFSPGSHFFETDRLSLPEEKKRNFQIW